MVLDSPGGLSSGSLAATKAAGATPRSLPPNRPRSRGRVWLFRAAAVLCVYLLLETILTALYWNGRLARRAEFLVEERGQGPTHVFDPVIGYRLNSTPSRQACFTPEGRLQSVGNLVGNNLGLPDTKDFSPKRTDPVAKRLVVFGDSFTAAQFLPVSWPTRAQSILRERGERVELHNCAVDGGGFLNWWNILHRLLLAGDFEFDGVIFAVATDDLSRGFFVRHDYEESGGYRQYFGRVRARDPARFPLTLKDAEPSLVPFGDLRVPTARFERALAGRELVPSPQTRMPALLTAAAIAYFMSDFHPPPPAEGAIPFPPLQKRLIETTSDALAGRGIPTMVLNLWVPTLSPRHVQAPPPGGDFPQDVCALAAMLDARYVDGSRAFLGLSSEQLRACGLIGDGHWNQTGSDRFALYFADVLGDWPSPAPLVKSP